MSRSKLTIRPQFVIIFIVAISLRLMSYAWNTNLYGDVNLFALTARQVAIHGRLEYPMKYDYSPNVPYLSLSTPASQHPPLWPLFAGVIASTINSEDTFQVLKWMSEFFGIFLLLLILIFVRGFRDDFQEPINGGTTQKRPINNSIFSTSYTAEVSLIALGFAAISPTLVDFSANGSPYILTTGFVLLASILLVNFRPKNPIHPILAGLICSLALLVHSILIFLPLAFLPVILKSTPLHSPNPSSTSLTAPSTLKSRLLTLVYFTFAFLLPLLPWIAWNYLNFGKPFYSYTTYHLFEQLGLLKTEAYGQVIASRVSSIIDPITLFQRYVLMIAKSFLAFSREYFRALGPFCLLLLAFGIISLFNENKLKLASILTPAGVYTLTIFLWATYKFRFLVPLLPSSYLLAAYGFSTLSNRPYWGKWIAWICILGSIGWMIPSYLHPEPTLYYGNETTAQAKLYAKMRPLAEDLSNLEPHVTLGYSQYLDGGIETVYWHRFPFVAGRGLGLPEIQKLICDFDVQYIWADDATKAEITDTFTASHLILQSPPFYIYKISTPCIT